METRELTCIRCPIGCHITVELDNGEVKSISGNSCPRGEEYAASEGDGDTGVELSFLEDAFNEDGIPKAFTDFVYGLADKGLEIARRKQAAK